MSQYVENMTTFFKQSGIHRIITDLRREEGSQEIYASKLSKNICYLLILTFLLHQKCLDTLTNSK